MHTTDRELLSNGAEEASEVPAGSQSQRSRWLVPVVIAALAVVAAVVALLLVGGGDDAPEDVVAQYIEAANARDVDALGDLFDPAIVSSYDASAVGGGAFNIELAGRQAVIGNLEGVWAQWGPTTTSYEVVSVAGGTVTTAEQVTFGDGTRYRHAVTYEVSDDGLILREDRRVVRG